MKSRTCSPLMRSLGYRGYSDCLWGRHSSKVNEIYIPFWYIPQPKEYDNNSNVEYIASTLSLEIQFGRTFRKTRTIPVVDYSYFLCASSDCFVCFLAWAGEAYFSSFTLASHSRESCLMDSSTESLAILTPLAVVSLHYHRVRRDSHTIPLRFARNTDRNLLPCVDCGISFCSLTSDHCSLWTVHCLLS